jgi:hypothetical protein
MRRVAISLAEALGDQVDELLAAQDAQRVVRVHHGLLAPGRPSPVPVMTTEPAGSSLRS